VFQIGFPTSKNFTRFFLIAYIFFSRGKLILSLFEIGKPPPRGAHLSVLVSSAASSGLVEQGGGVDRFATGIKLASWQRRCPNAATVASLSKSSSLPSLRLWSPRLPLWLAAAHPLYLSTQVQPSRRLQLRTLSLMSFPLSTQVLPRRHHFLVGRRAGAIACIRENATARLRWATASTDHLLPWVGPLELAAAGDAELPPKPPSRGTVYPPSRRRAGEAHHLLLWERDTTPEFPCWSTHSAVQRR
jgi:hypothetical protein